MLLSKLPDCCEFPIVTTIEANKRCVNCGANIDKWYETYKKDLAGIIDGYVNRLLRDQRSADKLG